MHPTGNVIVDGIAATQYGTAKHLPTWEAKDVERLKLAADAKMRMAYRMFPALTRRLHAWRLLTPLYNAVGALGRQVRVCCCQIDAEAHMLRVTIPRPPVAQWAHHLY